MIASCSRLLLFGPPQTLAISGAAKHMRWQNCAVKLSRCDAEEDGVRASRARSLERASPEMGSNDIECVIDAPALSSETEKMFLVFLNDKLISADSFAPLALEVSMAFPDRKWRFFVFDKRTLESIKANPQIFGVLSSLGPIELFTDHRRSTRNEWTFYRLQLRLRAVFFLAELALVTLRFRPTLIHFRALNTWPLRLLYLLNRRRTHIVQPSAVGSNELEARIERSVRRRKPRSCSPAASVIVHYDGAWDVLTDAAGAPALRIQLPTPFSLPSWTALMRKTASDAFLGIGVGPDEEIIAYMLNTMSSAELLDEGTSFLELFRQTLFILDEEAPSLPIVVKRHPATSNEISAAQDSIVREVMAKTNHRIVISNIHPQLIATRARMFVGNWYSSTFQNAVTMGVPTIQYSICSRAVREQNQGKNIRPDLVTHFFDGDEPSFRACVAHMHPKRPHVNNTTAADTCARAEGLAAWIRELGCRV